MMQIKRHLALLAVLLFVTACSPQEQEAGVSADPELERLAARAARVEIIRDDFGVPHVYGKTDADAVFGMLYAQAEDDFPRIERNYIWATGRLAEVDGEEAIYSDVRARLYMTVEEAKAAYASAPDWLRALCDAYADGLNYYLATNPDVEPALLQRFEPWMPMFFFEGSIGGDIERIPLDRIAGFYGGATAAQAARGILGFLMNNAHAISGNGSLDVLRYGRLLKARQLVGVRGAGLAYDGLYYVKSVTNTLKPGEFKQSFELSRNGLVSLTPKVPV